MKKKGLILLPLFVGLALFVLSWWQTYPLYVTNVNGLIFDRISVLYWIALPTILVSLFVLIITMKDDRAKCLATVCIVAFMYSLTYFYSSTPGSDSHAFRGLTEYFIKTGDLNPAVPNHLYFNYPSFFVLGKLAVETSGMSLTSFEFILYTAMGSLMAVALYKYFSSRYKYGGFVAVAAFFIPMTYYLNYQYAPFTLAFTLLLILLMVESSISYTKEKLILETILFTGMVFTHAFVPLFFILYELITYAFDGKSQKLRLLLLTAVIYFMFQITEASLTFKQSIASLSHASSEYSSITQATLAPVSVPIDQIVQNISRSVVVATVLVVVLVFIYMIMKRKGLFSRSVDRAIILSGIFYSILGALVPLLGSRAIPLVFIPLCLGIAYAYESRLKIYLIAIFAISLLLFVSIPIHSSFYDSQTFYQTQEAYRAENFMINEYNWTHPSLILAHTRVVTYLQARQPSSAKFESDFSPLFPRLQDYDSIMYTIGLGVNLLRYNLTLEGALQRYPIDLVYNNGFSCITIKSYTLTSR